MNKHILLVMKPLYFGREVHYVMLAPEPLSRSE
jgi:hypothetical protein